MGDLQKGYQFSGTSPNNQVTAEKLNTLVDGATILPEFYTGKAPVTVVADDDVILIYDASAGGFRKVTAANLVSARAVKTGFTGLTVGTGDGTTVSVEAREAVLRSDAGAVLRLASFAAVGNLSTYTSGPTAGGRDLGTITNNAWVYIWAISNGTNAQVLISQSASSPTMPSGYAYKALCSAARINNSGAMVKYEQQGNEVALYTATAANVADANLNPYAGGVEFTAIAPAALATFQPVDLSRCVPPGITATVRVMVGNTSTGAGNHLAAVASYGVGAINSMTQRYGLQLAIALVGSGTAFGFASCVLFEVPIRTSQQIDWATGVNAATNSMRVTGFTLNL